MNVLYLFADSKEEWNCSEWRCAIPCRAINDTEEHSAEMIFIEPWVKGETESNDLSEWADIIVIQRLLLNNAIIPVEHWKAKGKTIIADFDDDYKNMPASVMSYPFWKDGITTLKQKNNIPRRIQLKTAPAEQLKWTMKRVHAITSPSDVLLQGIKKYNKNTYLVPNYFQTDIYFAPAQEQSMIESPDDYPIIGWGGSFTHLESFKRSGVTFALRKVLKQGPMYRLLIAGGDARIVNSIKIPSDYKAIVNWMTHEEWPKILKEFDIGLIPLCGEYDKSRSWIKPIEYGLLGIPWIGSKMPMTEEFKDYGVLTENTPTAWARAITEMLENLDTYKEKAEANKGEFLKYDIGQNVDKIIATYQTIIDNAETF